MDHQTRERKGIIRKREKRQKGQPTHPWSILPESDTNTIQSSSQKEDLVQQSGTNLGSSLQEELVHQPTGDGVVQSPRTINASSVSRRESSINVLTSLKGNNVVIMMRRRMES